VFDDGGVKGSEFLRKVKAVARLGVRQEDL
jgi:hypothetical protein